MKKIRVHQQFALLRVPNARGGFDDRVFPLGAHLVEDRFADHPHTKLYAELPAEEAPMKAPEKTLPAPDKAGNKKTTNS